MSHHCAVFLFILAILLGAPRAAAGQATPGDWAAPGQAPPGGWAAAEQRLRSAIQLTPDVAAYHATLARVLRQQGRLPEALDSYRQAIRLDSTYSQYRGELASALLELKQMELAEEQFRQAIRLDSTRMEWHTGLARTLEAQGLEEEAARVMEGAAQINPGDPEIQRQLADYDERLGFRLEIPWPTIMSRVALTFEVVTAIALALAGFGLALPLLGGAYLLLVLVPLSLVRRKAH